MSKKGYRMAMVEATDPEIAADKAAFDKYGAKFLTRGGQSSSPERPSGNRHVIVEFESDEIALACFRSPEYQAALKFRRLYSTPHFAIVEGA